MSALFNILQREISTSEYINFRGMPFGINTIRFQFSPVNEEKRFAAVVLYGMPAQFVPSNDGRAAAQCSMELFNVLFAGSPLAPWVSHLYSIFHLRTNFVLVPYSCTVGDKNEKLVALAFGQSSESQEVSQLVCNAWWDPEEDKPRTLDMAGGRKVGVPSAPIVHSPSGKRDRGIRPTN